MKKLIFVAITLILVSSGFASLRSRGVSRPVVPPEVCQERNDYGETCITEEQGQQIANIAVQAFAAEFQIGGQELHLDYRWADPTENATYHNEGKRWWIRIFGGAIRAREVTFETVALIVCHELGHIHGFATKTGDPKLYGTEGEADYFAAGTCMPRVLPRMKTISQVPLPAPIPMNCQVSRKMQPHLCVRANQAAYAGSLFRARLRSESLPSFLTPDSNRVPKTSSETNAQCGLDTLYAGSVGRPRPRCWHHPAPPALR